MAAGGRRPHMHRGHEAALLQSLSALYSLSPAVYTAQAQHAAVLRARTLGAARAGRKLWVGDRPGAQHQALADVQPVTALADMQPACRPRAAPAVGRAAALAPGAQERGGAGAGGARQRRQVPFQGTPARMGTCSSSSSREAGAPSALPGPSPSALLPCAPSPPAPGRVRAVPRPGAERGAGGGGAHAADDPRAHPAP